MIWAARQLLVPCNYLRIRHGDRPFQSKLVYDFVLPICGTVATLAGCLWLGIPLAIFKHHALIKNLLELLSLMIVFYVAALAAVATFERKGIDEPLHGGPATLLVTKPDGGERVRKVLTYRQFISYLFGYLSFLSLCLFTLMVFLTAGWPKFEVKLLSYNLDKWVLTDLADPILFFVLFMGVWQLIFTSLLGIYFLTDRIQSLNDPVH